MVLLLLVFRMDVSPKALSLCPLPLAGIMNFITEGRHPIGQGMITYASIRTTFTSISQSLQHHACLIGECFRVAEDQGKYKTQFKYFHKSLFGIKGSFVVIKVRRLY